MDTVGYARIFTTSQHLDMQLDALKAAGCTHIRTDTTSGTLAARPGLDGCALAEPEEDDTLVVWRLDRLGRSLPHPQALRYLEVGVAVDGRGRRTIFHVMEVTDLYRHLVPPVDH